MPLPSSGSGSGTAPISGLVPPTVSSGGSSTNGYLSQTGVDLNVIGSTTDTLVLSTHTTASVQVTVESGAITSWAGALQGSIDGVAWEDVSGKTGLGAGITSTQATVTQYKLLRVITTTAAGAACLARISILAKTI